MSAEAHFSGFIGKAVVIGFAFDNITVGAGNGCIAVCRNNGINRLAVTINTSNRYFIIPVCRLVNIKKQESDSGEGFGKSYRNSDTAGFVIPVNGCGQVTTT